MKLQKDKIIVKVIKIVCTILLYISSAIAMERPPLKENKFDRLKATVKQAISNKLTPEQATQKLRLLIDTKEYKIPFDKATAYLAAGADANVKNAEGKTMLQRAVETESRQVVTLLLAKGADPNRGAPLVVAIENSNADIARQLINAGANPNQKKNNLIALYYAVENANPEIVTLLINAGADIDMLTPSGNTLLHLALEKLNGGYIVQRDNIKKIIKILYDNGADPNYLNQTGKTAYDLAQMCGDKEIIALFNQRKLCKMKIK